MQGWIGTATAAHKDSCGMGKKIKISNINNSNTKDIICCLNKGICTAHTTSYENNSVANFQKQSLNTSHA